VHVWFNELNRFASKQSQIRVHGCCDISRFTKVHRLHASTPSLDRAG